MFSNAASGYKDFSQVLVLDVLLPMISNQSYILLYSNLWWALNNFRIGKPTC